MCLYALRHGHRRVCIQPDRNAHFLGHFSPKPSFCPANAASRGGSRSPSKQSENQHQQLLNLTTFILDNSQLSPCFLSSKAWPFWWDAWCSLAVCCLSQATDFPLSFADWPFYSLMPSIMQKTASTVWAPEFFSWSRSKSTSLCRLFLPLFYFTKHTAVKKSPLTSVTYANSSI